MYEQQSYISQNDKYEFPKFKIQMDPLKQLGHHKIRIENIPILFPQKPYEVQEQYMKTVLQALNAQSNALLQSPTGTGKTLALLCATLAWINAGNRKQKIIYSSRTHSQLQQVAKELKKVAYQPNVCMLGSRNHLCLNDEINQNHGTDLNNKCNKLIRGEKKYGCPYYSREKIETAAQDLQREIMDIEDFKTYCKCNDVCPFYVERERMKNAEIILLPYNYLLSMKLKNYIDISDSILIFDEAHNVVQAAEDGYSFQLSQQNIANGIQRLEKWIDKMNKVRPDAEDYQDPTQFINIASTLKILQKDLNQLLSTYSFTNNDSYCMTYNGRLIIKILSHYFSQYNQDFNFFQQLTQNHRLANEIITGEELDILENYSSYLQRSIIFCQNHPGPRIKTLLDFTDSINKLFDKFRLLNNQKQTIDSYKLFIQKQNDNQITLSMICLDPSIAFSNFIRRRIYSIIITSGTLTPFNSWSQELKIDFIIPPLDNGHLPGIFYNVKGFLIKEFNFSFMERRDEQQIGNLGFMISNQCDVIPHGILLVFSSYQLMNMIKNSWINSRILEELSNKKDLCYEPQVSSNLKQIFKQYQEKAKKKGAILFCVQRGKVSEGIDFSDELCRAVFLIGVPYLAIQDNRVIEKMKFIDNQQTYLTGNDWYTQQAIRSANQALGRVIRHRNDYGAVFLCDSRYQINQLSKWVQPAIKTIPYINDHHYFETKCFFEIKGKI